MFTSLQIVFFHLLQRVCIKPILLTVGLNLAFDTFEVIVAVKILLLLIKAFRLLFLCVLEFGALNKILIDAVVVAEIGFE